MTLTHSNRPWSVQFTDDLQIKRAWLNDKRVKLTPYREKRIWNAFNEAFDLESEMREDEYETLENFFVEY